MKKWPIKIIVLFLVSIFIFSCSEKEEEIKIGIILPLTGPGAAYGQQTWEGINLAHKIISKDSESDQKLILQVEDSQTLSSVGVSSAQKLVYQDNVKLIIGALASNITLAISPIAEREKVLLLSPGSSADSISYAGDYIFRIAPTDRYDGKFLAETIKNKYGIDFTAVIYLNNSFGRGLYDIFQKNYEKLGGQIILAEPFLQGENNFRITLEKIKNLRLNSLLLVANTIENIVVLRQIKELNINVQIFAPSTFNDPKILEEAGSLAEGVVFSAASFAGIKNQPNVEKFLEEFKMEYDRVPTTFSAYGYDALIILSHLIREHGMKVESIKKGLYSLKNYQGASGELSFDQNGDAQVQLSLFTVSENSFKVINTGR